MIRFVFTLAARLLLLLAAKVGLQRLLDRAMPTSKPPPEPSPPKPTCRANDRDCDFCIPSHCPRGLCIIHCVCWCRGELAHERAPARTVSS